MKPKISPNSCGDTASMLDCRHMSARPRVHTILSLLAEGHAPAHLRPSILLAIDWPTAAEERLQGDVDDGQVSGVTLVAATLLSNPQLHVDPSATRLVLASLAARLATVAASLAASSDKAMAAHATALWGAAAALAGLPAMAPNPATVGGFQPPTFVEYLASQSTTTLSDLARKASDIIPGALINTIAGQRNLIATALDRVASHKESASENWRIANARSDALIALGWDGCAERLAEWTEARKQDRDRPIVKPLREILGLPPLGTDDVLAIVRNLKASESEARAALRRDGFPRDLLTACASTAITITGSKMSKHAAEQAGLIGEALRRGQELAAEVAAMRVDLQTEKNLSTQAAKECERVMTDNARLRAQVERMVAAMRDDAPPVKPRPQPGDRVPWAEVEDGALYWAEDCHAFRMVTSGGCGLMGGHQDPDIERCAKGLYRGTARHALENFHGEDMPAVLVARDLGTDPEEWRAAMREWTANGNRPAPKPYTVTVAIA